MLGIYISDTLLGLFSYSFYAGLTADCVKWLTKAGRMCFDFQTSKGLFNKGTLFNAGVLEIERRFNGYYDCFILHDVDTLPENDRILYRCGEQPMALSQYLDRYHYS